MAPSIAVKASGLTKTFGSFKAVDDITFTVHKGEIFGFLGANGAGKTTTIRMLCGLLMPTSGEATVNGFDIYSQSEKIKENIGYMSQKFSLYQDLTVEENIHFYGGIYGLSITEIESKTRWILKTLRLTSQRSTMTKDMPLGWKQGLALGCAILHEPAVLFLDEPTAGVDPISRREFWKLINELASRGTTIFVTTHFMDEAEFCHRLSMMHQGKIITIDSPRALKKKMNASSMEDVFVSLIESRS
ncbi:MAG: ABC transporter ATP-binding protein [candidate division KSB1 bacterium]|jgi:ABC-2 type transport system ATP-binding protein|nr:ABC transporter ATP-binding protein [candidate division KSB1 bacterium]